MDLKIPPTMFSEAQRVAMATRCRDCDPVPKVLDAGQVFELADGRSVQIMHNGLKMVAGGYYGQWMLELIRLCRGHHEGQEERMFHEVVGRLSSDARMIELGGHWSYYSLWFLKDQPGRQAIVIEPEPAYLAVGQANAELNGLRLTIRPGFAGATYSPSETFPCEVSGSLELPRFSVHQLLAEHGWDRLELLHADIQGAETELLESCRDLFLAGCIDWVFVSTHAHQISGDPLTHQCCLAILRECGATIEAEHDVHESFSGDGLIVARFGAAPPGWQPVEISHNRASKSLFRDLAFDLAEQNDATRRLSSPPTAADPLHRSLRRRGLLLTLDAEGPLGGLGDTLLLPDDQVMSGAVRSNAGWDAENLGAFAQRVPDGQAHTLIDVGANIGLFTRQLMRSCQSIDRAICVEPDPENFRALQYNLSADAGQVECHQLALGDADGKAELLRDRDNIGNYSLAGDAMRDRPHDRRPVEVRETAAWLSQHVPGEGRLLWKSDTQGFDELIVSRVPWSIWDRIDVALMEIWRIDKPHCDRDALAARIDSFPNRRLGEQHNVSTAEILDYAGGTDWQFLDLLLWR